MNSIAWHPQRPTAPASRPRRASSARPRIACVHLLTRPTDERELRSVADVSQLNQWGIKVVTIVNPPYTGMVPMPRETHDRCYVLTPSHYGAWRAHRDAIYWHLRDVDGLLVCECDCLFCQPVERMVKLIHRALEACQRGALTAFTLGYKHGGGIIDRVGDDVIVIDQFICCHCYMVPLAAREVFLRMFELPWDTYDYCTTKYLCDWWHCRIGAFADRPAAVQSNGVSICTGRMFRDEQHYRNVRN